MLAVTAYEEDEMNAIPFLNNARMEYVIVGGSRS
jgi:hypothetical protein